MKKRSEKQHLIKRNEFRFHNVSILNMKHIRINKRHPAYIFYQKGNIYVYVSLTHSEQVNDCVLIELRKNPNSKDNRASYRVIGALEDTKDRFSKRLKSWFMDKDDESDIRDEYKKR